MSDEFIPNPVPAWMETRARPVSTSAEARTAPAHGRRPAGARRPPERHFPGFEPPAREDLPLDEDEIQPDPLPPADAQPALPPAPPRPVEEIVQEAVNLALARAAAGELTVDQLLAERERLIALRPSVDDQMRDLKQMKPDYWRERRAWLLVVRTLLHNRLHIINRQIGALQRAAFVAQTDAETPAATAEPAPETPPADQA
jgi:hypothetical protein